MKVLCKTVNPCCKSGKNKLMVGQKNLLEKLISLSGEIVTEEYGMMIKFYFLRLNLPS